MKQAWFELTSDKITKNSPPCKALENIDYSYEESDLSETIWDRKGQFWIGIYFYAPRYKEVVQSR